MRGKWIKTRAYPSDENPYIAAKVRKILLDYHQGKISKKEFDRKMAELYGEPMCCEKYLGEKKKGKEG